MFRCNALKVGENVHFSRWMMSPLSRAKKPSDNNDFFLSKPYIFFYFFCDSGEILKYRGLSYYFFVKSSLSNRFIY